MDEYFFTEPPESVSKPYVVEKYKKSKDPNKNLLANIYTMIRELSEKKYQEYLENISLIKERKRELYIYGSIDNLSIDEFDIRDALSFCKYHFGALGLKGKCPCSCYCQSCEESSDAIIARRSNSLRDN